MRRLPLLGIIMSVFIIYSCKKDTAKCPYTDSTDTAPQAERDSIKRYLGADSSVAVQDPSGVFYIVTTAGTGVTPTVCSDVLVQYSGTFFNSSTPFDATPAGQSTTFTLGRVIVGWQKALSAVKAGSSVTLYVPPALGYGYTVYPPPPYSPVIPPGSYLKFTIQLLDVQ